MCIAAGLPGLAVAEPSVFFGLGGLTGPLGSSAATAVSSDGEVVVGQSFDALGDHVAFRWTAEGGMVGRSSVRTPTDRSIT